MKYAHKYKALKEICTGFSRGNRVTIVLYGEHRAKGDSGAVLIYKKPQELHRLIASLSRKFGWQGAAYRDGGGSVYGRLIVSEEFLVEQTEKDFFMNEHKVRIELGDDDDDGRVIYWTDVKTGDELLHSLVYIANNSQPKLYLVRNSKLVDIEKEE